MGMPFKKRPPFLTFSHQNVHHKRTSYKKHLAVFTLDMVGASPDEKALGLIAGAGILPQHVAHSYEEGPVCVAAFHGQTQSLWLKQRCHQWFYIGQVGRVLEFFKKNHVRNIVMAGHFTRPSLRSIQPDLDGMKLISRIGLRWGGDDFVMTQIKKLLQEDHGFIVKSPQDIAPHALVSIQGALGTHVPNDQAFQDIRQGRKALAITSSLDFGQGIVLQNGMILGIEAAEGTNRCIERCGQLALDEGPAPIYIKRAKVNQSSDIDLPFIGTKTIECLARAGFQGIGIQSDKTLLLDSKNVVRFANQNGLFLWAEP